MIELKFNVDLFQEARKLPVMRGSTVPSERWAPMSSGAPPLVKSSATVPSRIQLLSSSLASQRKPYWCVSSYTNAISSATKWLECAGTLVLQ